MDRPEDLPADELLRLAKELAQRLSAGSMSQLEQLEAYVQVLEQLIDKCLGNYMGPAGPALAFFSSIMEIARLVLMCTWIDFGPIERAGVAREVEMLMQTVRHEEERNAEIDAQSREGGS